MLLRYIVTATLQKAEKTKQSNGTFVEEISNVKKYKIQYNELTDEVSASVYGANLTKMLHIKSIRNQLETYLIKKVNNTTDNISLYYVEIKSKRYKITSVNESGINLELV